MTAPPDPELDAGDATADDRGPEVGQELSDRRREGPRRAHARG